MKTTKAKSQMRLKTVFVPALMLTATLVITPLAVIMTSFSRVQASCIESREAGFIEEEANNLHLGQEICVAQANGNIPIQEILEAHNKYRSKLGLTPLTWSTELANSAQQWADHLAETGGFNHSGGPYGENLAGAYPEYGDTFTKMVDRWGSEKQYFRYGTFPDVSSTGSWYDVGHYTQIIWRNTTEVGCGYADRQGTFDVLVCQYNPPGNYTGQEVY